MSEQVSSPSSEQAASPVPATAESSQPSKVQRYATEADVLALMTNDKFKKFCKKKCGECGCVAFKRFAKMSPLVVRARVGSLWCQKCGRLLCEAHRNQHSCEMEMQELERRRRVDVDAIREGIKRQEEEKEQRAADADALKRAEAGAKAARYRMWKDRRRHVVWCPASF
uniref:Uncharacterized protein n=1 Tax=Pelagomonas calceolata TaxID=35677 RepID=A0A7S3ZKP1_9STRA